MNETRRCTIEQIEQFLMTSTHMEFSAISHDREFFEHIGGVLER
ncbi:MAG: hypothetical protein WCL27_16045 [Betaproteobacteria bacterium]